MSVYKKVICFIISLIIFLAIILIIKIKVTPKYNQKMYEEIYDEYEGIFGQEDNENSNYLESISTTNNIEQLNVIGKIIIPKIDITYPIIKETTTEYLKIAPTKYCGPEVNEIRKFGYSWS